MNDQINFRIAYSNSFPSGSGSLNYKGSFQIIVQNVGFEKEVSVLAKVGSSWTEIPAHFSEVLPDNLELWEAPASNKEVEFVAKLTANSQTFWDNNDWNNYKFPQVTDDFAVVLGNNTKIAFGDAFLDSSKLTVLAAVQNLGSDKDIGIIYTTDNWESSSDAKAQYNRTMSSGFEVWKISVPMSSVTEVKFALYYKVNEQEYWDNNFWRNYTVSPRTLPKPKVRTQEAWIYDMQNEPEPSRNESSEPKNKAGTPVKSIKENVDQEAKTPTPAKTSKNPITTEKQSTAT